MSEIVKAAIVQDAPRALRITDGVAQAVKLATQAVETGAKVIAFGETFLGGYPLWLDEAPGAALWDHPGTKALHGILLDQALRGDDPRLVTLQKLSDLAGVIVSVGGHERVRSSLLNTQYLFRPRQPVLRHRKLVPTHGERMIWARGDGSTMDVHEAPFGNVGQLICWEHWMPLARATMHHAVEAVHVAAWPTVRDLYLLASCHYAFEGRCFVLAAGTVQHKQDLIEGLERAGGDAAAKQLLLGLPEGQLQFGRSAIVAPDGVVIAQAGEGAEILTAPMDLSEINHGLATLDTDGHYARPDIFELRVDRRERTGIIDIADDAEGESAAA